MRQLVLPIGETRVQGQQELALRQGNCTQRLLVTISGEEVLLTLFRYPPEG